MRSQMRSQPLSVFPNDSNELIANFRNQNFVAAPRLDAGHSFKNFNFFLQPDPTPGKVATGSSVNHEEDSPEDYDFSDAVLTYIDKMLMEEDVEEMTCMLQNSIELQAAEKSFYEVLGKKYPPSSEQNVDENNESQDGSFMQNLSEQQSPKFPIYNMSQSSCSVVTSTLDGLADSRNNTIHAPDWNGKIQSICQFNKGVEEATKFLPRGNNLFVNLDVSVVKPAELNVGNSDLVGQEEKKDEGEYSASGTKGRKNLRTKNFVAEEERRRKQTALYPDLSARSELFDTVLLSISLPGQTAVSAPREAFQNGSGKLPEETNGRKCRGRKPNGKMVVDMAALLICCAEAFAAGASRNANELLKQIKQHASLVDFGILYGFQWPTLIQRLSMRRGGPPKLRITGIDVFEPGFRPAEGLKKQNVA